MPRNAIIQASTGLLLSHGFVETTASGQTLIPVTDTFALDPGQWQWNGSAWVAHAMPDWRAFELGLGAIFTTGTVALLNKYSAMLWGLRDVNSTDTARVGLIQGSILAAQAAGDIDAGQYTSVKAAATAAHIPVTLP